MVKVSLHGHLINFVFKRFPTLENAVWQMQTTVPKWKIHKNTRIKQHESEVLAKLPLRHYG